MFDNIKALRLIRDTSNRSVATAMISSEGEIMEFRDEGGLNEMQRSITQLTLLKLILY